MYMRDDQFDRAIAEGKSALELHPGFRSAHLFLGWSYQLAGRHDEAVEELRKCAEYPGIAANLARSGRRTEAEQLLAALLAGDHGYVEPGALATVYLALGDTDAAINSLEGAVEEHSKWAVHLRIGFFDELRSDPRYQELVRRVGFPE